MHIGMLKGQIHCTVMRKFVAVRRPSYLNVSAAEEWPDRYCIVV